MAPVRLTNTHPELPRLLDKLASSSPSLRLVGRQGEVGVSRDLLCLASPLLRLLLPSIPDWEQEVLLLPFCSSRALGLLVCLLQEGQVLVGSRKEQGEVVVAARVMGINLTGLEVMEEKGEQEMVLEEQEVSLEEQVGGPVHVKQEDGEWQVDEEYSEGRSLVPRLKKEYGQDVSQDVPRLESESSTSSLVIANIASLRPSSYSPPTPAPSYLRPESYSPSPSVGAGARIGYRQLSVQEKEVIVKQAVVDKVALENLAALNGVPVNFVRKLVTEGVRPNQAVAKKQGFSCKKCPYQTFRQDHLYKHITDCNRLRKMGGVSDCNFCRVSFRNPVKFHLHMREMHINEVVCCPECEFTAFKSNDIRKHVVKVHNNGRKLQTEMFPCNVCKLVASSDKGLTQHKRDKHGMVNIPMCRIPYCNRQNCPLRHPNICVTFMEGTCPYNPCEFRHEKRREDLEVNTEPRQANPKDPRLNQTNVTQPEVHNSDESYCNDCDTIFASRTDLEKHQRTYRFVCLSCIKCVCPLEPGCESHKQNIVKK